MAEKFDPARWGTLEDPRRLEDLPPAVLIELLGLDGDELIVDYGAGTGFYTMPLAEAVPHGRVVAVDEQREMLQHLAEKLTTQPHLAERVEPVCTEDSTVPLPNGGADRIVAINVLHHVHDDPTALAEMTRLLAPAGRMLVIDFGYIDRPIGPDKDHVLPHARLRAVIADMGLRELAVHEPGTLLPYHIAIVAEKLAD